MTSSMLAGERRWASARRGGMTVLGKVAVPKPINLPSQKLENHGLDPNVEIVPKGSLSWGSRPSSSTSNPWGSSAVSPNTDGTNVSPHHPSGRPSSGGGLSRPSTAGSDRHEPSVTTWGPNSRPSSASGVLTSKQSPLTSSRPLSAETRPGSSHLSRFAEPAFDNSMTWGPNGTTDKMSIPSKATDFSLSSGDFPTLGSEKDNTAKCSETHDHGSHVRPGSGSGRTAPSMDRNEMVHGDHKSGTVDTWTRDSSPHFEDGVRPGVGKWQGDPQQYINPNVPPQHFDAWRGPPMNAPPTGVWYRGPPPAGPPYPPVPHGGYPMEPYPYYHPQIPPNLANPQSGPPPGSGPRGHHPRNGDFYRPQMHDAFIRPGMPIRPGFYPGPVPYDGYYRPPMGYNPNDRDIPFMGMPPGPHGPHGPHGPPLYNMGPPQNPPELNDAHFRGSGHGSGGNMFASEQPDSFPPEESRGPYKVLRKPDHERHADMVEDNWEQNLNKSDQPRSSFHNYERGVDTIRNEDMPSRRNLGYHGHTSDSVAVHSHEGPHRSNPFNESLGNKSSLPEVHQDIPANPKDSSLIQKIEGLNAKVRASDGSGVVREEQKNRLLINPNHKENSTTIAFGTISDIGDLNNSKSTTASASLFSRQTHHGVRSQPDHHSKGRLNNQDTDGWRKKPSVLGSDVTASVSAENLETKNTGESLTSMADPADGQVQRARMRELAKQRAIQLQKEEEERIREQKAKALAKLEELNRRTLAAADGTTQNAEKTVITVLEQEDEDGFQKPSDPVIDDNKHEETVSQISENSRQEPVDQPLVSKQSVANATDTEMKAVLLDNDGNFHKQKRAGHRQKQGVQMVESSVDKLTLNEDIKASETKVTVSGEEVPSQQPSQSNISNISFESTVQRKRNNKISKNNHKLDDASASKEGYVAKPEYPQFDSNSSNVLVTDGKDAMQSNLEQISSFPSNQFKPQHPRRMSRNPQANNRTADKFHVGDVAVWAPVRAQNKEERVDDYSQRTQQDDVALPAKTINSGQTNLKNKRAEMERYVPKPVAKELAQQGTSNQSSSPSSPVKTASEDMTDRQDLGSQPLIPVSVSVGPTVESKVGDNKQNKQVKSHGAWKLRGPTDLNRDQGFQQDSKKNYQKSTSHQHEPANPVPTDLNRDQGFQQETKRSYQKSMSRHEPANPVSVQPDSKKSYQKSMNQHEPVNPVPTETNVMHEWDPSDGWFMPDEVPPVISVPKDEGGVTGKGKKPAYKVQRNTVKNHNVDHKDINDAVEIDQSERPVSSNENRSSQWQPKPQSHKGGWSGGSQTANSAVKPEEPVTEYKNVRRAPHERKPASFKGHPDSSNQGFSNMEDENLGFRKYGGQNNRFGGQDNRRQHNQHNPNINRERQRQNLHYEYQPVGSNNNTNKNNSNKSSNHDAPAPDGSGNEGPRYKERGPGQSRRGGGGGGGGSGGNFHGRQ